MHAITQNDENLDREIEKCVETVPVSIPAGPRIEELELDGWIFTEAETKNGFTLLFFTRFQD